MGGYPVTGVNWEHISSQHNYYSKHIEVLAVFQKEGAASDVKFAYEIVVNGELKKRIEVTDLKLERESVIDKAVLKYTPVC